MILVETEVFEALLGVEVAARVHLQAHGVQLGHAVGDVHGALDPDDMSCVDLAAALITLDLSREVIAPEPVKPESRQVADQMIQVIRSEEGL